MLRSSIVTFRVTKNDIGAGIGIASFTGDERHNKDGYFWILAGSTTC